MEPSQELLQDLGQVEAGVCGRGEGGRILARSGGTQEEEEEEEEEVVPMPEQEAGR